MAEQLADSQALESTTVGIYRTATVVKGGRRFSFAALVAVGDRRGNVGIGYGKAPGVPAAIEKAQKDARKQMFHVELRGGTMPHPVTGRFGASKVILIPAAPGTGVIAGGTVRAVLELAGVQDCLSKAHGSTNKKNLCKAVIEGLKALRTKEQVAAHRNVEIGTTEVEEKVEAARKFMAETSGEEATATAPGTSAGAGQTGGGAKVTQKAPPKSQPAPKAQADQPAPEAQVDQPGPVEAGADEQQSPESATPSEAPADESGQASSEASAPESGEGEEQSPKQA